MSNTTDLLQKAFRTGTSTRLDDRVYAMCQMKSQPLVHLMKMIHPNLYRIDKLIDEVMYKARFITFSNFNGLLNLMLCFNNL